MTGRFAAILAATALLAGACGNDGGAPAAGSSSPGPVATSPAATSPPPSPEPSPEPAGTVALEVWFHEGERLAAAYRTVPATEAVGRAAMEQLLDGPTGDEAASALGTQAPSGSRLLGLTVSAGIATVDLSKEFSSGGGSLSMSMRLAQVVYTLTQFGTVDAVRFEIAGEPVTAFGGEGLDTSRPLGRADFEDLAPPIVVASPRPGSSVSSGVEVTGDANVFEATVSFRVLDADGNVLKEAFTTATCGTGCRGTYAKGLKFSVSEEQDGTIEVFSASAEDGSPQHMVSVPVRLVP